MQESENKNPTEKITIQARLPIPLDELPSLVLKKGEDAARIVSLLDNQPKKISRTLCKEIRRMLEQENPEVEIIAFGFDYYDSPNITHGIAYFTARLEGTENDLRGVAGDREKFFLFDWPKENSAASQ